MHTRFLTNHSCCDFLGVFSIFFDFLGFFWIFLLFSLTEFNGQHIKINEKNLTDRMASVSGHLYAVLELLPRNLEVRVRQNFRIKRLSPQMTQLG